MRPVNLVADLESRIAEAMAPYWSEYPAIGIDADARSASSAGIAFR